ncbi:MAG: UDP-3-O-acyl-N-acetylglucosamine deacetylase [Pseudanabaenaceae cyanobacterium SKYGB_i_bin29]|nr:UDP-3-O-acyl-N-acetylglucosamine deacetylase [Pseudanabaenaceae cyanobacterium SKYG29]MDW8422042.1 UDP-3-O-acyl-N-acetylglucosamine deacetylase [Pseudanabaenaceae cyanobacterium SKYGB_i_bin29]
MVQKTIGAAVSLTGVGLHSGKVTTVTLAPAPANTGRYFVINGHTVPARVTEVKGTVLSTEIGGVRTVEHLLSALWGMGIDNVAIEVEGEEIPIGDGSALPWVELIAQAGIVTQAERNPPPVLSRPVWVQEGDRFVVALPAPQLQFTYGIDFPTRAIGVQWFTWMPALTSSGSTSSGSTSSGSTSSPDRRNSYVTEVAPARTFTMADQVEKLRSQGLIQGGSLENAIVCDQEKWLNPPLRFPDEPCRHKLLDLIGDLSLVPHLPVAHYIAYKASHNLHIQLARSLSE